jgi:hypothetical protein
VSQSGSGKPDPEIRGVELFQVDRLVLAPKWQPLNGVDPSCWILKPSGSNILHDIMSARILKTNDSRMFCEYGRSEESF